jgi:hypothetical protein
LVEKNYFELLSKDIKGFLKELGWMDGLVEPLLIEADRR